MSGLRIGPQLIDGLSAGRSPPRRKRKGKEGRPSKLCTLEKPWRNRSVSSFSRAISFRRIFSVFRISASSSVISLRSFAICDFIVPSRVRIVDICCACSRSRSRQCRSHICSTLFTYKISPKNTCSYETVYAETFHIRATYSNGTISGFKNQWN